MATAAVLAAISKACRRAGSNTGARFQSSTAVAGIQKAACPAIELYSKMAPAAHAIAIAAGTMNRRVIPTSDSSRPSIASPPVTANGFAHGPSVPRISTA